MAITSKGLSGVSLWSGLLSVGILLASGSESWGQNSWRGTNAQKCAVIDCTNSAPVRQPYVAPPPTAQEIANDQARDLNRQGIAAGKAGDDVQAANLYRQALSLTDDEESRQIYRGNLGNALLRQGNRAYSSGNYEGAIELYQLALSADPDNSVTRKNISLARSMIASNQASAAWDRDDYQTALIYKQQAYSYYPSADNRADIDKIQQAIQWQQGVKAQRQQTEQTVSQLKDAINQKPADTSSSSLELMEVGEPQRVKQGEGKVFGRVSNPLNPDLGGPRTLNTPPVDNTLDLLDSVDKSSKKATTDPSIEIQHADSGCGFDKALCATPDHAAVNKNFAQTPVQEMLTHIPDTPAVRNDPEIKTNVALYSHLENLKAEKQVKIDDIQKQIKANPSSAQTFTNDLNALTVDVKNFTRDQTNATSQIKEKLKKNYGLQWIENPAPGGSATADGGQPK